MFAYAVALFRSIRPPDPVQPNATDPAGAGAPGTVGPDQLVNPGDPSGVTVQSVAAGAGSMPPSIIYPSGWSGWPADWGISWGNYAARLTDTAWVCVDLNSSILASMEPFLVNAAPSLDSGWMTNPEPDLYTSWQEFAKQLFWDFQLGEVFVLSTARYTTGWPARFHVVPPWMVDITMDGPLRAYEIGGRDVTADMLHIRYQSTVWDLHGHGPLEAVAGKVAASGMLARYASQLASQGGIPSSVLEHPEQLTAAQAQQLRDQWVQARVDALGAPAVLSGGVKWTPTQMNPEEMSLQAISDRINADIAVALRVPPDLLGLPGGGTQTYKNVTSMLDYHWRAGLRPFADAVMDALSGWLLPRGTEVQVNSDTYVQPEPYVRAQTAQIYNNIRDEQGNPVMTVQQIQEAENLMVGTPTPAPTLQGGGPIE